MAFRRLQAPWLGMDKATRLRSLTSQNYPSLSRVPTDALTLYPTQR